MQELYGPQEVARLLAISVSQVRYWERSGLILPCRRRGNRRWFDFRALVAFRTVKELLRQGISLHCIRRCLATLKQKLPASAQPLAEVRLTVQGRELVCTRDRVRFTAHGQLLLDFGPDSLSSVPMHPDPAEELLFQALESEAQGHWHQAGCRYKALLAQTPHHIEALVHLGIVLQHADLPQEAEDCLRWALRFDPDHVEANFHMAQILEARQELAMALLFYEKTIQDDSQFAAPHIALARLLDQFGDQRAAQQHWRAYLTLAPDGEFAAYVKSRLEERWEPA